MSRTKWTVQRCHGAPRTRAIAFFQAGVLVADAQTHAGQAALPQRAQEGDPERLRLRLADVEPDHLAPTAVVDAIGHDECLRVDVATVADLDHLGVEPQVRVAALQRSVAERADSGVEPATQCRDAVAGHATDAELFDQAVELARGHAVDVGLHDHRHDRLLGSPARLQERGEVGLATALALR